MKKGKMTSTFDRLKPATEKEQKEILKWKNTLDELDNSLKNNNRRHREKHDGINDFAIHDTIQYKAYSISAIPMRLSYNGNEWLEYIFSQQIEDLHELIPEQNISEAIMTLTDLQKEVLYLS